MNIKFDLLESITIVLDEARAQQAKESDPRREAAIEKVEAFTRSLQKLSEQNQALTERLKKPV